MYKDFYSVKEFAEKMGVCTRTIRRAIENGRIIAIRIGPSEGSPYRIPHTEIERMAIVDIKEVLKKIKEFK